jgi:predicted Zn-dependent protease
MKKFTAAHSAHDSRRHREALRRRVTACIGGFVVALSAAAMLPSQAVSANALPSLGGSESSALSPAMERKLGEQIMRDIRYNRDYLDDPALLEYLNTFGNSLVAARPDVRGEAQFDYFFFAVRDPAINAFALPGGFIGVHSALLLSSENESQLASVLAHEIGHVSQRHIARMLGAQKQDMLIPLASAILAALATQAGGDASAALLMGGQGLAMQRQLNFTRNAEREADRVGLQILDEGGFDTEGMVSFFGRMQSATRGYSDAVPPYLLSHPLTTERIADIQARIQGKRYKQRADSIDFHFAKARARVLQDDSAQGLHETATVFDNQLLDKSRHQNAAAKYGLAMVAMKRGETDRAKKLWQEAKAGRESVMLTSLGVEIHLAANEADEALALARAGYKAFPLSRTMAYQVGQSMIAARQFDEATEFLRDQAQQYREEVALQELLAEAYAGQGRRALQHLALAQAYALIGSLPTALDQLTIARRAPDASFYDQAIIDARERELRTQWREQIEESKRMP